MFSQRKTVLFALSLAAVFPLSACASAQVGEDEMAHEFSKIMGVFLETTDADKIDEVSHCIAHESYSGLSDKGKKELVDKGMYDAVFGNNDQDVLDAAFDACVLTSE